MRYILDEKIALRSWHLIPCAYSVKGQRRARGLKHEEFDLLVRCDGASEIEDSPLLRSLAARGLCRQAREGEVLSAWQRYKDCDNRYMASVSWQITGRCNYNCLHCFNAADNAPLMSEWTMEEAGRFMDDAERCGIQGFTLTGGEPMLHPHFIELVEEIYRHGMFVDQINTNGWFINRQLLDRLREIGCVPLIKISFDGLGWHDWLRNRQGAEADTLRAIRLCIENDFPVKVQTNVHRRNVDTMYDTARLMDDMGVSEMRIIRTSEAPRWVENAGDSTLGLLEYFDRMLEFAGAYSRSNCQMDVDIWQFMTIHPATRGYAMSAVRNPDVAYRDSLPVCRGNRGMAAVSADGEVYPCHQLSGCYAGHGWHLGNVKTDSLQKLLQGSSYLTEICTTLGDLKKSNAACNACKWFRYCCGGCRAIAVALTGDKLGVDKSKCLFYSQEYYKKMEETMGDWTNLTPVDKM